MKHHTLAALLPLLLVGSLGPGALDADALEAARAADAPDAGALAGQAVRLRQPIDGFTDLDATQARDDGIPPLPADAVGIGPGSPILTTIPGEGTFICTANYVFTSGGRTYLGAAGHCFLPEGKKATHGSGADYNAGGVVTEVCVDFCVFGGQLTGLLGDFRTLGQVAYARQTGAGGDIGNDFGVVEVPSALASFLRAEMPVWGGPTGLDGFEGTGEPLVHYGNGIDAGSFMPTKGRIGTSLNDGIPNSWQANLEINGGDSGSPVNHAAVSIDGDVVGGTDALGVVTHGLITGAVPLAWGTSIEHAISMAGEAGLNLQLVLEGGSSGGGGSTAVHVHSIDTSWTHFGGSKHRVTTTVAVRDASGSAAPGVSVSLDVTSPQGTQSLAGTTDSAGVAVLTAQGPANAHGTWTSCVTNLSGPGYTYDSPANAETCQATAVS